MFPAFWHPSLDSYSVLEYLLMMSPLSSAILCYADVIEILRVVSTSRPSKKYPLDYARCANFRASTPSLLSWTFILREIY